MKINKVRIKNYRSIKDSGDINLSDKLFVLAGQNESGKSSILNALKSFDNDDSKEEDLNFELELSGNKEQEIAVTYTELSSDFYKEVINEFLIIMKESDADIDTSDASIYFDEKTIQSIKEFKITKVFKFGNTKTIDVLLDENSIGKLKGAIKYKEIIMEDQVGLSSIKKIPYLNIDQKINRITAAFWNNTVHIVLFNDFQNLLPDTILLNNLENKNIEGIKAVKNIEKLLQFSFKDISQKSTPRKNAITETESESISTDFQKDWQQKIYGNNKVNIKIFIENNNGGEKEISFFVETKQNEFLEPRRRSKGMIWFLSLWLELKAREDGDNLFLMFDEPGLHLHVKANKDMLSVFHKLINKGHQIIYSTHSPSLIETNRLHNIGLVINNEREGTTVEGLTTSKINTNNKRDALQPIAEAMGIEPLKDFSVLKERNVLLEGLSDFWYFSAMRKVLGLTTKYEFIPGIGIKGDKLNNLISFCIGYGLKWVIVIDNGKIPTEFKEYLKENVFSDNEKDLENKLYMIPEKEIENLFHIKDLILVDSTIKEDDKRNIIDIIGQKRKILFSRIFMQKVANGEIKKDQIHPNTIKNFEAIFKWIDINL